MEIRVIPISQIDPNPSQPRQRFTAIDEMAASIQEHGVLTPLLARPIDDRFQLIDGERRYRAALQLSMDSLPVSIHAVADETAYILSVVENLQREDLTPLEEADAFAALQKFGLTQKRIAETIGRDQSYVAHKIALRQLPAPVLVYLESESLTEAHLRQLAKIERLVGGNKPATYRPPNLSQRGPGRVIGPSAHLMQQAFGAPALLAGLCPVGEDDWHVVLSFATPQPAVVHAIEQMLTYVARHSARPYWHDAAFYFASVAVQEQMTTRQLDQRLDAWQRDIQRWQAQWEREHAEAVATRTAARADIATQPHVTQAAAAPASIGSPSPPPGARTSPAPPAPIGADRLRTARRKLEALPEDEREQAEVFLAPRPLPRRWGGGWDRIEALTVQQATAAIERLITLPDQARHKLYRLVASEDERDRHLARAIVEGREPTDDPRLARLLGLRDAAVRSRDLYPDDPLAADIDEVISLTDTVIDRIRAADQVRLQPIEAAMRPRQKETTA